MENKIQINNRRYIGSKSKLLKHIEKNVKKLKLSNDSIFADLFAGTGVVASHFSKLGYKTVVNDILYSNYVVYKSFLGSGEIDFSKVKDLILRFNSIDGNSLKENYFSKIYGNKYFSEKNARKIGFIRDEIEFLKNDLTEREYYYLVSSLIYATDKIANTVGHFESFLNKIPKEEEFVMKFLDIEQKSFDSDIYNMDSNKLAKIIKCDIAYIDPPYNARQYINFYHVLENLARWNKPKIFKGKSMKFERSELMSDYSRKKAPEVFKDLISNIDAKYIIVSYNNTYMAKSSSSINTISEEDMMSILKSKGKVKKIKISYNPFNAGKTTLSDHFEYLFICEVY